MKQMTVETNYAVAWMFNELISMPIMPLLENKVANLNPPKLIFLANYTIGMWNVDVQSLV